MLLPSNLKRKHMMATVFSAGEPRIVTYLQELLACSVRDSHSSLSKLAHGVSDGQSETVTTPL